MMKFETFDPHLESIIVLDKNEQVIYCNEAFATLVGIPIRKIVHKIQFGELFSFSDQNKNFNVNDITDPTPYKEVMIKTASQKEVLLQYTVQKLPDQDFWIVFFKDVTLEERLQGKYRAELEKKEDVIAELEKAKIQLEDYSKNLEKKVEERTQEIFQLNRQMKALLDSLTQGFLMFNSEGECSKVYSGACQSLFEQPVEDQKVWEVFGFDSKKQESFKKWMTTLFSEMLPFEDLEPLGPKQLEYASGKILALDYYPLRDQGNIESVVVVATEITSLLLAQSQAKVEKEKADFILNLFQKKNQFAAFLAESEKLFTKVSSIFEETEWNEELRSELLRYLHTIKGSAAIYSLSGIPEACHELEEQVKSLSLPPLSEAVQKMDFEFEQMRLKFKDHQSQAALILGERFMMNEKWFEISSSKALSWIEHLQNPNPESLNLLRSELKGLWLEPAGRFFTPYADLVQQIAHRLGKKLRPLEIKDHDSMILAQDFADIFNCYVHVFRNAIDHGLETPEERLAAGKDEFGKMQVLIKALIKNGDEWLEIQVMDDGRGIPVNVLREKLIQKNPDLADSFKEMSDYNIVQHIFDDQITTKNEVSELSGRGVGLHALKMAVEESGGWIHAVSQEGRGTLIAAQIPIKMADAVHSNNTISNSSAKAA